MRKNNNIWLKKSWRPNAHGPVVSFKTETRRVQRNIVPHVLLVLPAHLGKHYWTSARSREEAKGLLAS